MTESPAADRGTSREGNVTAAAGSLLPKEHGAYGQIAFPLLVAFCVGGLSIAGLLFASAVIAAFLAHEPAAVLLGQRGARARRELRQPAIGRLRWSVATGAAAGLGALLLLDSAARWSLVVPGVPALFLSWAMFRGQEKSWYGELAAALAFAGAAVPVAIAAGAPVRTAAAVAIPFALLFAASTLAVRVVILRVRRGGDVRAVTITRRAALLLAAGSTAAITTLTTAGILAASVLVSALPGALVATVIALRPPAPAHLRVLGWTIVGVSVLTAAIVVLGHG